MSVKLCLMPFAGDTADSGWACAFDMLEVASWALYDAIEALPSEPVPNPFNSYRGEADADGEHRYGNTQETSYGNPLLCTTMKHLKTVNIPGPVGAYITASPDRQKVVALYWH